MMSYFDAVIISPGPGSPQNDKDFGVCKYFMDGSVPVFGVCLGFQGIAYAYGSLILEALFPTHGIVSDVNVVENSILFKDVDSIFSATRYHSLTVDKVKYPLVVTAQTIEGDCVIAMALEHVELPLFGVQFHPESICSEHGKTILFNFLDRFKVDQKNLLIPESMKSINCFKQFDFSRDLSLQQNINIKRSKFKAEFQNFEYEIFHDLYSNSYASVWLDSARKCSEQGRYSVMAGFDKFDQNYTIFSYWESENILKIANGNCEKNYKVTKGTFAQFLDDFLRKQKIVAFDANLKFTPGLFGYFGYEMKSECLVFNNHLSPFFDQDQIETCEISSEPVSLKQQPDSIFLYAQRIICFDSETSEITLLSNAMTNDDEWLDKMRLRIHEILKRRLRMETSKNKSTVKNINVVNKEKYIHAIKTSKELIKKGETYEVCLTTPWTLTLDTKMSPLQHYNNLRRSNPAPFGAFMKLPYNVEENQSLFILSSSPEKFMSVASNNDRKDPKKIIMKPIKGTIKRSTECPLKDEQLKRDLESSIKDRAENLMIVDLIRNDLNRICLVNTVRVPKLMVIESYQTVHQLVSQVEGETFCKPFEILHSCFPPGSMTGAPKKRTVELLMGIEREVDGKGERGVYSGVCGFVGLNDSCDFSVVIRTAVFHRNNNEYIVNVGAGGAITIMSEDQGEYGEMETKAMSVIKSMFY